MTKKQTLEDNFLEEIKKLIREDYEKTIGGTIDKYDLSILNFGIATGIMLYQQYMKGEKYNIPQ